MSTRISIAAWLVLACRASIVEAKLEAGTAVLTDGEEAGQWHFVGKFGYTVGSGTYDVRMRLPPGVESLPTVNLEVYLDEDWDRVMAAPACRRAMVGPARKTHVLRASAEWSPWLGGLLEQNIRPHIWYFALSRCGGYSFNDTIRVEYELRALQPDESELSVELRYMPGAVMLSVTCLTAFLARFWMQCKRFQHDVGRMHPVILILAGAVLMQWLAQVLRLAHLQVYERDGVSGSLAELSAGVLFMLSQVVSSTLLVVIAQGYSLLDSKDFDLDSIKPAAAAIAVLHVMLVGHDHMQAEHAEKHHEHEGLVGWTLLLVRLLLCAWFVSGVQGLRRSGSMRLQPFLQRFQFVGCLYLLSFPAIYLLAQLFAHYLQQPIMEVGLVVVQTVAALWLSDLFMKKGGSYYEVSELSSSLLPGGIGTPTRRMKRE